MTHSDNFWETKTLEQMSPEEWELLCDGCGKCCLHKLQDDKTDDIYYTSVACDYLNLTNCLCKDYVNRKSLVPECIVLSKDNMKQFTWLPSTCAYRVLAEGGKLSDWHPLISSRDDSVHQAGVSVRSYAVAESEIEVKDFEDYIVQWDI